MNKKFIVRILIFIIIGTIITIFLMSSGEKYTGSVNFDKKDNTIITYQFDGSKLKSSATCLFNGILDSGSFKIELINENKEILFEDEISKGEFKKNFEFKNNDTKLTLNIYPKDTSGNLSYVVE